MKVHVRSEHMNRTGARKYGIRNRTIEETERNTDLLRNLNEFSEKTRRLSVRIDRVISVDPVPD